MFSWLSKRSWISGEKLEREGAWWSVFAPKPAEAGVYISERNALQITTVFACVRIISETIASLPLHVYKRADKGKDKAVDHPVYSVLHDEANPEMSAFSFWETIVQWMLTHGNAYAEIERNGAGQVVALWPLAPDITTTDRNKQGQLIYRVHLDGKPDTVLPAEKVLHFHGMGWDGRSGYSPIQMAKEALGFAKATEKYGSKFFSNGGKPGGVLEMEGTLRDKAAADRVRESWAEIHGGPDNSHRVAILEAGMKYKPISLPPNDAQFLETRRFQKADIAQIFRVPLHMINDLSNATFSNIEHQSIEFVVHTIRPYLVRMEQEIRRKLFITDRGSFFAEWLVDGLLRGDAKSRNEALQIQRQNGIINADEWRAIENMNPQEGEQGKAYLVNSAMIAVDQALLPMDQRKPSLEGGDTNGKGAKGTDGDTGNKEE